MLSAVLRRIASQFPEFFDMLLKNLWKVNATCCMMAGHDAGLNAKHDARPKNKKISDSLKFLEFSFLVTRRVA